MLNSDDIVVRVEKLGKRYLVPQRHDEHVPGEPKLRDQLKEFFPGLLGARDDDYFWALKDISFTVKRGEVFGIVGQNGSGKSTLLKILSRVTPPTEGVIDVTGRVGSLLEVGTGFHSDLTGRQNVFFNGALLGVPREEIRKRLDAIIAFSGIGPFIDVPVKRYSSGMYVRLAYSVASLLESDIMVLDEVLAVGDAAFRDKTERDIRRSTAGGKTVLLVSHNPQAIVTMCDRGVILDHGRLVFEGSAKEIIGEYLSGHYTDIRLHRGSERDDDTGDVVDEENPGHTRSRRPRVKPTPYVDLSKAPRLRQVGLPEPTMVIQWLSVHNLAGEPQAVFKTGDGVRFRIGFKGLKDPSRGFFSILIHNTTMQRMVTAHSTHMGQALGLDESGVVECVIPSLLLGDGLYNVMVDHGVYDFETKFFQGQDTISHATYIQMTTDGFVKGVGLDEFRGAAHLSEWAALGSDAGPCRS
jgi:lipopolysaccharide transport system ATP-binding protein